MADDSRAPLSYATHDPPERRRRLPRDWPPGVVLWSVLIGATLYLFCAWGVFADIRGALAR